MEYLQHLLMRSLWVVLVVMLAVENGCNGCLEKERIALLQLKDSINFPNGISLPSWEEDDNMDCCQWERVECNSTTHQVIKLELYRARDGRRDDYWHLNASILHPFESLQSLNLSWNQLWSFVGNEGIGTLSNLHYLEELDLSVNYLDNSILPSLNKLSNLKILNLAINELNGSISAKGIGTLSNLHYLEELDLSDNHLDNSILPSLNKLSNLKILNLARNKLNGSISAKGLDEEEDEEVEQKQATKKLKALSGSASKAVVGTSRSPKVKEAAVAGRTRGSVTKSPDQEESPPTPATRKSIGSKTTKPAHDTPKKPQVNRKGKAKNVSLIGESDTSVPIAHELDEPGSSEKQDGSEEETQAASSSKDALNMQTPIEKKPILLDLDDESFDKFFQTVEELVRPSFSGTSGSGIGSSTPASYAPEEIIQAKEILKAALGLGVDSAFHQDHYSSLRKSMNVLTRSQALGGNAEPALQSFLKNFPILKKSYESATQRRILATSKLNKIDDLQQELAQGFGARDDLKTEIGEAKAKRKNLLTTIQALEQQLDDARQQMADHERHEAQLAQRRQELVSAAQGPLDALQVLLVEKPAAETSRDQAEVAINDAVVAWENLKASLESEL